MREDGFYWVKHDGLWIVAVWIESMLAWKTPGSYVEMRDEQFEKIEESKLTPPLEIKPLND